MHRRISLILIKRSPISAGGGRQKWCILVTSAGSIHCKSILAPTSERYQRISEPLTPLVSRLSKTTGGLKVDPSQIIVDQISGCRKRRGGLKLLIPTDIIILETWAGGSRAVFSTNTVQEWIRESDLLETWRAIRLGKHKYCHPICYNMQQ